MKGFGEIMNGVSAGTFLSAMSLGPIGLVVVLILSGILLLGVELFILPGFGVAGIVGIAAMGAGVVAAWFHLGAFWGSVAVAGTLTASVLMLVVTFRSKVVRKRFVLDAHLPTGGGTESQDLSALVGKTGTAHTDLRPAGIAEIEGERLDVVSDGGYIERGISIRVVEIEGPRVIVSRVVGE